MSKVTSKFQVTIPRSIARTHGIEPGSEITFESAGEVIRIRTGGEASDDAGDRVQALRCFDASTRRQEERDGEVLARLAGHGGSETDRGWTREDLYEERRG